MKYKVANFKVTGPDALIQTARDLIADLTSEIGFEAFEDTDNGIKGYVQRDLFDQGSLDYSLSTVPLEGISITYSLEDMEDKDWNEQWEEAGFEPIDINRKVLVYDARRERPIHTQGETLIGIKAKQAFGTGTHYTTQMVIESLLELGVEQKCVLDCGCGTGILGITASKLGATEVVGYDIDEWSADNAKDNAVLNGVHNMQVLCGDASVLTHVSGLFDVVLANINRNILLNDMSAYVEVMASKARLVMSGFYEEDIPLLLDKAISLGLEETGRKKKDEWCCLQLQLKA
jgi:ribosomal protein L11 methyltransferase